MIILLSGWAGSGKNTVASFLEPEFKQLALADGVREFLYLLDPQLPLPSAKRYEHKDGTAFYTDAGNLNSLAWIVNEFGWENVKRKSSYVRELMQRLGTEAAKTVFGQNCWVNALELKMADHMREGIKNFIITDVRFKHEIEHFKLYAEVYTVRVGRLNVRPANDHISENELNDYRFDYAINNVGTLEELKEKVLKLPVYFRKSRKATQFLESLQQEPDRT